MIKPVVASVIVLFAWGCSKNSSTATDPASPGEAAPSSAPVTGLVGAIKNAVTGNTQPFEGEIAINVVEANRPTPQTMTVMLKGQKLRFETEAKNAGGQPASGILDLKEKKLITVLEA